MDYEKAWKELKEVICDSEIIKAMNELERKYDTRYLCIKAKDDDFIKGNKYEVIDQDQNYIWVVAEEDYTVALTYDEFSEYFEVKEN